MKKLCLNLKSGVLVVFLVPYLEVPAGNRLTGKEKLFIYKKNYRRNTTFYTAKELRDSKPNSWKNFSLGLNFVALYMAKLELIRFELIDQIRAFDEKMRCKLCNNRYNQERA